MRGWVEQFRSHPATLAWYIADELTAPYVKLLEARHQMCHEIDPDHPTWAVLNQPENVRVFVNGYDCVAADSYPIGNPAGNCAISQVSDWVRKAQCGMYRSRAMWQDVQTFDWAPHAKFTYAGQRKNWKPPQDMRMPTREEMRSMTWQSIAGGANGVLFYAFGDAYRGYRGCLSKEEAKLRWADVCAVVREVKDHEELLLSEPGPDVENVPEGMICRTWRTADGKVHLLACNTGHKPIRGCVRISGEPQVVELPPIGVLMR